MSMESCEVYRRKKNDRIDREGKGDARGMKGKVDVKMKR